MQGIVGSTESVGVDIESMILTWLIVPSHCQKIQNTGHIDDDGDRSVVLAIVDEDLENKDFGLQRKLRAATNDTGVKSDEDDNGVSILGCHLDLTNGGGGRT